SGIRIDGSMKGSTD
ncbi:hypothetical protein A2U01_0091107, partial [Trifolium medium]|nr:hypothetical protein [Trifolium medium]